MRTYKEFCKRRTFNVKNEKAVVKKLELVQKKCCSRCIDYKDILYAIGKIEYRLDTLGVLKKNRSGMVFVVSSFRVPCYYRWPVEGTIFTIKYNRGKWFIKSIHRGNCFKVNVSPYYFINEDDYRKYFKF